MGVGGLLIRLPWVRVPPPEPWGPSGAGVLGASWESHIFSRDVLRTRFGHGCRNLSPELDTARPGGREPPRTCGGYGRVSQLLLDAATSMASLAAAISIVRLRRTVMALTFVSLLLGVLALTIAIANAG